MRFPSLLILLLFPVAALAAPDAQPDPVASVLSAKPVPVAVPVSPARMDTNQRLWLGLDPAQRAAIVDKWQKLPETTRPPFPIFRDAEVVKCLQSIQKTEQRMNER